MAGVGKWHSKHSRFFLGLRIQLYNYVTPCNTKKLFLILCIYVYILVYPHVRKQYSHCTRLLRHPLTRLSTNIPIYIPLLFKQNRSPLSAPLRGRLISIFHCGQHKEPPLRPRGRREVRTELKININFRPLDAMTIRTARASKLNGRIPKQTVRFSEISVTKGASIA